MGFTVGTPPETAVEVKEQVTAPDRITPFGSSRSRIAAPKVPAPQLRHWADTSEWVRAAVNHRRVQVSQSEWGVVAIDDQQPFDEAMAATIELIFLHPNNRQKTFRELIEPVVEDILVLDRGVIEKEITVGGFPEALHLVDGASIRTVPRWSGKPEDHRYEWWPNNTFMGNLLDNQIMLMMANPSSHRIDGFSPLEALKATIDADMEARDFNTRMVRQTSPNGILNLGENVGATVVDSFRMYWDAEVAGKKQMGIIGGVKNPEFINLGQSARDMQYMQWQVYLLRKIAAVFGIAPQDLGITFDVNRATATTQQDLSEDRGFRPLLRLVEEQINSKVLADFAVTKARRMFHAGEIDMETMRMAVALTHVNPRGHRNVFIKLHSANLLNMTFRFRMRSAKSSRDQADYNRWALAGIPWETVDEVRARDGLDPVAGGDQIIVMTPIGAMPLDMIGGQTLPTTQEQRTYLDGLFQSAPIRAGQPAPALSPHQETEPEVVTVVETVYVDEDGEETDPD